MPAALVLALVTQIANAGQLSPAQIAAMRSLEGSWGLMKLQPSNSQFGEGLLHGAGVCGGPKMLDIVVRQDADHGLVWTLRLRPEQDSGATVVTVDAGASRVVTYVVGDRMAFQRRGDTLAITTTWGGADFRRCVGGHGRQDPPR